MCSWHHPRFLTHKQTSEKIQKPRSSLQNILLSPLKRTRLIQILLLHFSKVEMKRNGLERTIKKEGHPARCLVPQTNDN